MAYEDFTGYTEVDPNSDFTITASKIAVDTLTSGVDAYVRDDKGASHFGDFEHLISGEYTSVTGANNLTPGFWGMSSVSAANTVNEMGIENDGMALVPKYTGSQVNYRLWDYTLDNSNVWTGGVLGTQYWFTIERASTTLTCKIYGDSARTDLKATLSITCNSDTQQYVYGFLSQGSAGTKTMTGFTENLDLQEVVAAGNPWYYYAQH